MPVHKEILKHCRNLVSDPDYRKAYLLGFEDNKGVSGYFSNYIPQEIIAAAGFHPLRIIGCVNPAGPGQHDLLNPVCSFVQDVYTAALSGGFSFLKNIIFPNSCDSLKLLRQMWDDRIKNPPAYTLLHRFIRTTVRSGILLTSLRNLRSSFSRIPALS